MSMYIISVKNGVTHYVGDRIHCEKWLKKFGYSCYIHPYDFETTRRRIFVNTPLSIKYFRFDERVVQVVNGM